MRWIRAAKDDAGASLPGERDHRERVSLGHQVDGDAHDRRTLAIERLRKIVERPERRVENADAHALGLEMRRQIEQAERRMRTHHALLGRIECKVIAVCEQDIHYETCCGGRTKS